MKLKKQLIIILGLVAIVFIPIFHFIHAESGGYDVQTHLIKPSEVGAIKDATDDSFKTITSRCMQSGIPSSSYGNCCQAPIYWLNPSCPYQMKGQDLIYEPKQNQFSTDEESEAYQSVIDCLKTGSTNCQSTGVINNLVANAKSTCDNCNNRCKSNFQSCNSGCQRTVVDSQAQGDGPWTNSQANAAYRVAVQCLRNGSSNCIRAIAGMVPSSSINQILTQAYNDVRNGTVWEPKAAQSHTETDSNCQASCNSAYTSCTKACPNFKELQGKIVAAASKAMSDFQQAKTNPATMPQPKPLTYKFNNLEKDATKIESNEVVDENGKALEASTLKNGLGKSLPEVNLKFPTGKVEKGQYLETVVRGDATSTLPVDKILFAPKDSIDDGTMTVTIGDNTKPELFIGASQAKGQSDYEKPNVEPDHSLYDTLDFIRIDAKVKPHASNQYVDGDFVDVLFSMVKAVKGMVSNPLGTAQYPNPEAAIDANATVELLHFNKKTSHWDELSTEKAACFEGGCRFTAESPGASTFALVVKKKTSAQILMEKVAKVMEWVFLVLWFGVIIFAYNKLWSKRSIELRDAKTNEEKSIILQRIGFGRFVMIRGVLLQGFSIAWFFMALLTLGGLKSWVLVFFFINIITAPLGFTIGAIGWLVLKHKYNKKSQKTLTTEKTSKDGSKSKK